MMKNICVAALIFAAGLNAATAAELNLPHHKVGLWRNDIVVAGKTQTNQSCLDDVSEAKMVALSHKHCASHSVTHNPDGSWTTTGTCEFSKGEVRTSTSTVTGDFNTRVVMKTHSSAAMPDVTITATWLGACKPDQRGGDIIASDGSKINMLDLMASGKLK